MITLTVVDSSRDHITIEADEPVFVEASTVRGMPIITVFRRDDNENIIGCYDGTIQGNKSWRA